MKARGFSLIQVVVALALLSVVGGGAAYFLLLQQKLGIRSDKRELMMELIQRQIAEVSARPISSLPAPGNCISRTFSPTGQLQDEQTHSMASSQCTTFTPPDLGMRITILIESIDAADYDYDPAQFLKLPEDSENLKQVRIVAGSRFGREKQELRPIGITIFKRG